MSFGYDEMDDYHAFDGDMEGDCPDCEGTGEVCCSCGGCCDFCIDGYRTCMGCGGSGYLPPPEYDEE
jgi:hypothetical protein